MSTWRLRSVWRRTRRGGRRSRNACSATSIASTVTAPVSTPSKNFSCAWRETAVSPRDVLQQAISLHQQGRLADAEPLYRQILAKQPAHFDALHLLGVVRMQQGRGLEALELIEEALKVDPRSARALSNHGLVLFGLGRQ